MVGLPLHPDLGVVADRGEGFFAKLTRKRLRRGSFRGIVDLQAAIHRFVAEHSKTAKRFVWTADPDRIIPSTDKATRAPGAGH